MTTILIHLAATSIAAPWQDGLTHQPITDPFASFRSTALIHTDRPIFSTLRLGTPFVKGRLLSLGVSVDVSGRALFAQDGRTRVDVQNIGGRLGLTLQRPESRASHSWWVEYHNTPNVGASNWHLLDINENGILLSAGYRAQFNPGRAHLFIEGMAGTGDRGGSAAATGAVLWELVPQLSVGVGLTGPFYVMGSAIARARLGDHTDLGVALGSNFPSPFREEVLFYPSADLRITL